MESTFEMIFRRAEKGTLDKNIGVMVKYIEIEYRVEWKEYLILNHQRVWVIGCKPGQGRVWESASGSGLFLSDK